MGHKKFDIQISHDDISRLRRLTTTGKQAARTILRARILLGVNDGLSDSAISEDVGVCLATVANT